MRSPPARGWPGDGQAGRAEGDAFPARAGMARACRWNPCPTPSVPRPRGDGPVSIGRGASGSGRSPPARGWPDERDAREKNLSRSPPARGWPVSTPRNSTAAPAFPARAGMARRQRKSFGRRRRVPRPRGDGPNLESQGARRKKRSPPARGWPERHHGYVSGRRAFPARAGMARSGPPAPGQSASVPRPRGDGPRRRFVTGVGRRRSPPARGWPAPESGAQTWRHAFPARAGMARPVRLRAQGPGRVPRPRGDGPT